MSNIFESLAGRVAIIDMLSLSTREIKNDIMNSEEFIPSLNIQNNFGYNETINIEELYDLVLSCVNNLQKIDVEPFLNDKKDMKDDNVEQK